MTKSLHTFHLPEYDHFWSDVRGLQNAPVHLLNLLKSWKLTFKSFLMETQQEFPLEFEFGPEKLLRWTYLRGHRLGAWCYHDNHSFVSLFGIICLKKCLYTIWLIVTVVLTTRAFKKDGGSNSHDVSTDPSLKTGQWLLVFVLIISITIILNLNIISMVEVGMKQLIGLIVMNLLLK